MHSGKSLLFLPLEVYTQCHAVYLDSQCAGLAVLIASKILLEVLVSINYNVIVAIYD